MTGCGKTVARHLRVRRGGKRLGSGRRTDITRLPPDKRNIAMVFQSYALWPHMTVVQNIGCGLKLRGVGRAEIAGRVAELLAMLRLEGLGARKVTALSGGQRQRVALGRMFTASLAGNYQIAANTALILLVPSIAFMLLIVRFLNTEMLATVG